jgi:hypothetical protein
VANYGPWSKIIALGKPVCFQISSINSWLVCSAMMVFVAGGQDDSLAMVVDDYEDAVISF